jgi:ABC-2 type transport system permease protein
MSTTLLASSGRSTAVVLGRTAAAEWGRLWTVRSTWWCALATTVAVLGVGTLAGIDLRDVQAPEASAWEIGQFAAGLWMFILLVFALVTTTADHTSGGIVPTLQWTPRRAVLLAARTSVIVVSVTVFGQLLVTAASLTVHLWAPGIGLPLDDGARALGWAAFVHATCALLAVGIGLATRSTGGGLAGVFAVIMVLPLLLQVIPHELAVRLIEIMPGSGVLYLLAGEGPGRTEMTTTSSVVTLVCWAVAALAVGGWRLLRTDADG